MNVLYIIIPAYNEAENLEAVIKEWYEIVERHDGGGNSRLVVINDGSRDNTWDIIRRMCADRPLLQGLTKENSGHAPTCMFGYAYALEHGADYVFQTDSDGQTKASEFEKFWENRENSDVLMGFRPRRGDGFSRLIVSRVLRLVIRFTLHVNVRDANVPYRLMKAEALKRVLPVVPKDYILGNVLLSVAFAKTDCSMAYLPITFEPRSGGKSMYNWKKIFGIGWNCMREFVEFNKVLARRTGL